MLVVEERVGGSELDCFVRGLGFMVGWLFSLLFVFIVLMFSGEDWIVFVYIFLPEVVVVSGLLLYYGLRGLLLLKC